MKSSYAGIGSRETPESWRDPIKYIASLCESVGLILRSGGADGADDMFESGVIKDENKEIFLPWRGFNNRTSNLYNASEDAYKIAEEFHPYWNYLKPVVRNIMARNSHQILGKSCQDPVDFVVCWTINGELKGGTAQALRIAENYNIPIFNLGLNTEVYYECIEFIKSRYVY